MNRYEGLIHRGSQRCIQHLDESISEVGEMKQATTSAENDLASLRNLFRRCVRSPHAERMHMHVQYKYLPVSYRWRALSTAPHNRQKQKEQVMTTQSSGDTSTIWQRHFCHYVGKSVLSLGQLISCSSNSSLAAMTCFSSCQPMQKRYMDSVLVSSGSSAAAKRPQWSRYETTKVGQLAEIFFG